ncbi:MAG: hypothetical protein Q7S20_09915 [Gemmatimonadaceae bacterium]|nr:hypothetical protein [Gemmatimonadaceae bacterium]
MAMEVIAYEKLRLYAPRLPAAVLDKWQPPQAMRALLEFEPLATQNKRMRMARTTEDGTPLGPWIDLGEHRSFNVSWLRKAYNKLGSFLHVPSPRKAAQGIATAAAASSMRDDLLEILKEVEHVAASRSDLSLARTIEFNCAACESLIICNEDGARTTQRAICLDPLCAAEHYVEFSADGGVMLHLIATEFDCMACKAPVPVEDRKLAIGYEFACPECREVHVISTAHWGYSLKTNVAVKGA